MIKIISLTLINLVTPKDGTKHELLFNKWPLEKKHDHRQQRPSWTHVAQQSQTKIISLTLINVVTSKAGAQFVLLFNKLKENTFRYDAVKPDLSSTLKV